MKYKVYYTVALACIVMGSLLFFGAWAAADFGPVELGNAMYEKKSLVIEESFSSISINGAANDVRIGQSPDELCRVEYMACSRGEYKIAVEDDCLTVLWEYSEQSNWQDCVSIGAEPEDRPLIIYLPRGSYEELSVDVTSADFEASGLDFEKVEIHSTSGDIEIGSSLIGSLSVDTRSGETELENVICEGKMTIKSTGGDIELERCDALSLELESSSGEISGLLLSGKDFDVQTRSGSVKVPKSSGSGKCTVKTKSGDIEFFIAS